jgi:hypothetical protein
MDLLNDSVYLSPPVENYTLIVLYDEDGTFLSLSFNKDKKMPISTTNNKKASTSGAALNADGNAENDQNQSIDDQNLINKRIESEYLINSIRNKLKCSQTKTMYVLAGGYKEFSAKFRFMCSHLNIRSTVDRNKYLTIYPNCVIQDQIYIGSAIQAKNWKIIRDLRITHIINATYEHECVFKDEIKYLHVEIEDSYDEKINITFKIALKFICEAFDNYKKSLAKEQSNHKGASDTENGQRGAGAASSQIEFTSDSHNSTRIRPPVFLIHCNLGISRSSSILIAYLIAKYGLCLYAAFKYVKDKRLQIAPNYSFLRQLKQFEESIC